MSEFVRSYSAVRIEMSSSVPDKLFSDENGFPQLWDVSSSEPLRVAAMLKANGMRNRRIIVDVTESQRPDE